MLAANHELEQLRGELGFDIRLFSVGNYAIIYRPYAQGVEIVRVLSGFRDLDVLFSTP
jgi:toxin ParE1/3/4